VTIFSPVGAACLEGIKTVNDSLKIYFTHIHKNITEILLKVELNILTHNPNPL
jgi:hypothetical protein